jgi:hypothetical protein
VEIKSLKNYLLDEIKKNEFVNPGCYILFNGDEICRLGGVDNSGILYIGKANNLKSRLNSLYKSILYNSDHSQTQANEQGHKALSRKFFRIRKRINIENLKFLSIPMEQNLALELESYLLESYVEKFAELPPLNGSYGSFSLNTSYELLKNSNFDFDQINSIIFSN